MTNEAKASSVCPAHSGVIARVETLEGDHKDLWDAINFLRNRPPVWCTFLISGLTGIATFAFTYAAFAVKIAEISHK